MPSTYTQNLGLEKPATGEQAGVWGTTANTSYDSIDTATDGNLSITLSASSYSLNTAQGAASEGRNKLILWGGTLTQVATVNITPNTARKLYIMQNNTSGGFSVNFQQGSGGAFTLQAGYSAILYTDGAGATARVAGAHYNPQFGNVLVTGTLTVDGAATFAQPQTFSQPVTFSAAVTMSGATTTIAHLQLNTPGYPVATNDLFYRSASGDLIPLPIGASGQLLEVSAGGAPTWATVSVAVGGVISGSVAYGIYFSNASNVFWQDQHITARSGVGIGIGLVPTHALHLGYALSPEVWLDTNTPIGQQREIGWATNGTPRWLLYSPIEAESGNNAGSNLNLIAYNDAASISTQVLCAVRASGNVTLGVYGDLGSRLAVVGVDPSQAVLLVRGASGQGNYLQVWQNNNGTTVASIDVQGNLTVAGGGFLTLTSPAGRLDLHGTVTGHPLGTIHIGPEPTTTSGLNGIRGSIALESAQGGTDGLPPNTVRLYYRNGYFMIQFYYNGINYWASIGLQGQQGVAPWNISSSPPA